MYKNNLSLTLTISTALLLLPGCAGYKSEQLRPLAPRPAKQEAEKRENISVAYKVFSPEESKKYLGKDVIKAGYQPIQISLYNDTKRNLLFSPSRISLPCVSGSTVAQKVHDSTKSRAIGWSIAGLFVPVFLIPAIVDTCWSVDANQEMNIDYENKSSKERIINPVSCINGVIFVPIADFKMPFSITLLDEDTQEKIVCLLD